MPCLARRRPRIRPDGPAPTIIVWIWGQLGLYDGHWEGVYLFDCHLLFCSIQVYTRENSIEYAMQVRASTVYNSCHDSFPCAKCISIPNQF